MNRAGLQIQVGNEFNRNIHRFATQIRFDEKAEFQLLLPTRYPRLQCLAPPTGFTHAVAARQLRLRRLAAAAARALALAARWWMVRSGGMALLRRPA